MSADHAQVTIEGRVTHIFGHRFVLETAVGSAVADLGPDGVKLAAPIIGERLTVAGEQKPSEITGRRGDARIVFHLSPDGDIRNVKAIGTPAPGGSQ